MDVPDPHLAARQAFVNPGGMWMPTQMTLPIHQEQLRALGTTFSGDSLAYPAGPPLAAVVQLNGCTGSFVSPEGLIITNHHCVQDALQASSSPDHDYIERGYLARTRAEEKPVGAAARVLLTTKMTDVTATITRELAAIGEPRARKQEIERRKKSQVADCERDRPEIRCEVASFFRGAEFWLIEQVAIRDVRLVYAPPRSIGNYGDEIDNWAWPRHTGDFALYRAYVDTDGIPADPSPQNIPYAPPHWFRIATAPLAEHDVVMVAGYPGGTQRITTYSEVQFDVDWTYPTQIQSLRASYAALEKLGTAGGSTAMKAGVLKSYVQNDLENTEGMLAGLKRGDTLATKKAADASVRAWAAGPGREDLARKLDELEAFLAGERAHAAADAALEEVLHSSMLASVAHQIVRMAEERQKPDGERQVGFQDRDVPDLLDEQGEFAAELDAAIDRALLRLALVRALELPESDRPWLRAVLGAKRGAPLTEAMIDARLSVLYKGTRLSDEATRVGLFKDASPAKLRASKDPFVKFALALRPATRALDERSERDAGDRALLAPAYATAMRGVLGGALAPDANSTLRVTYGTVKRRGDVPPFTVASEILAKDTGSYPFDAPASLLTAVRAKQWGPYADPALGELPVNFLSDVDTTGGNSGSPTLNGRGELVGLLFDGTIESVSSDVVFDPAITRSIHLDIRYALWVMDLLDGADHLLTEMGVTPSLP